MCDHVQGEPAVAEHAVQVRGEQRVDELADLPEPLHPDPQRLPDDAARAVRADHEPGPHARSGSGGAIAECGGDPGAVVDQVDQFHPEPDLAAQAPQVLEQHRFEAVLRAADRQHRADREHLPRVGRDSPAVARRPRAGRRHRPQRADPHVEPAQLAAQAPGPQQLHRAQVHAGGPGIDRGTRVPLDHQRPGAVADGGDRGGQPGRPGPRPRGCRISWRPRSGGRPRGSSVAATELTRAAGPGSRSPSWPAGSPRGFPPCGGRGRAARRPRRC